TAESQPQLGDGERHFHLQWGRGLSTAESDLFRAVRANPFVPSMGPRSFNRGKLEDAPVNHSPNRPSMGPRSFNRGKDFCGVVIHQVLRAFNGAAVFQPRKDRLAEWANKQKGI